METVVAIIVGGLCLIPVYLFGPGILKGAKFALRGVGVTVLGGSAVLIGLISVVGGAISILSIIALFLGCYVLWHQARKHRAARQKALAHPRYFPPNDERVAP